MLEFFGIDSLAVPESLEWTMSPVFILIVTVLAIVELLADKNADVKEFYDEMMVYLKAGVAILVSLAVVPEDTKQLVPEAAAAGWVGPAAIGLVAAVLTWFIARMRAKPFALLMLIPANLPFVSVVTAPLILIANLLAFGRASRRAMRRSTPRK